MIIRQVHNHLPFLWCSYFFVKFGNAKAIKYGRQTERGGEKFVETYKFGVVTASKFTFDFEEMEGYPISR